MSTGTKSVCLTTGRRIGGKVASVAFSTALSIASPTVEAFANAVRLTPPLSPACVSSPFGPRIIPDRPLAGTFHSGVDIPGPVGRPVLAVAPGRVIRIHRHGVGGLEVLIQHDGFIGVYSHLGLVAPTLAEGQRTVYPGQKIGVVGRSGLTYGPHLYFGMIVDGQSIDPTPYLGLKSCSVAARSSPAAASGQAAMTGKLDDTGGVVSH